MKKTGWAQRKKQSRPAKELRLSVPTAFTRTGRPEVGVGSRDVLGCKHVFFVLG